MGHWRLRFPFEFARHLGYRYLWQSDDDTYLTKPIGYSLVQYMRDGNLSVAPKDIVGEPAEVTRGLAELTRYHIEAEKIQPTFLYEHCR